MKWWVSALAMPVAAIGFSMIPDAAYAATPTSPYCKNAYKQIATKPKRRAMALSEDGRYCHSYWAEQSQAAADRKAIRACQDGGKRKCTIVRR